MAPGDSPIGPTDDDRYRRLVERVPAVIFELSHDVKPHVRYVSPTIEVITGYDVDTWAADPDLWREALFAADRTRVMREWDAAFRSGVRFHSEYRLTRRDGSLVWVRETTHPVRDADGEVTGWQGVIVDISEQRFAEEAAARTEARYRSLIENLPVVVYVDSPEVEPRSLYVSPNSVELLGYAPAEHLADATLWKRSIHRDDVARIGDAWATAVRGEGAFAEEYRLLRPDGTEVWVRDSSVPVRDDEGLVVCWQGVMLDITRAKEAESELRGSERRYRALVEQMPVIVYLDAGAPETETSYVSPNVLEILGRPAAWFVEDSRRWYDILHPDDRDRVIETWRAAWRAGIGYHQEFRFVRPEGSVVWVRDSARVVNEPDRGIPAWQGVLVDITPQKLAEQELRGSEQRYRALVEQVPAVVYEMGPDVERHTLYVSPHVESVLGYTRREWLDQPDIWMELLDEEDREIELAAHDLHTETREPWDREYRLIASDGRRVWIRDQATLVEDPATGVVRWYGVMLDITARKEAEEALRLANDDLEFRVLTRTAELEEATEMMALEIGERRRVEEALRLAQRRYRDLVEDLPAVVYAWETDHRDRPDEVVEPVPLPYVSPKIEDLVGYTPQEWQSTELWKERLHPHDRAWVSELADRCAETGEPFTAEYRFLAKDGHVVWVLDRATLLARDSRGVPAHFQGVMLDITARKEAEAKAEAAEERYRHLAERGPVASYVFRVVPDSPIEVEYVSPQLDGIVGYPTEEMRANPNRWLDIVHPDDRERVSREFRRVLETGAPLAHEYRAIRADGAIVWLRSHATLVERDGAGRPSLFQGAMLDVTAEREAAEEIARSEEALRALAEGLPAVPWAAVSDPETGIDRYTYIGPQALDLLGYTPEELIAEPSHFGRMVHPEDRARVDRTSKESDRTGVWNDRYRVIARDGSVRHLHGAGRRTITADGLHVWHGVTFDETAWVLSLEDGARAPARAGTDAASPEAPPTRPPAGGSPAGR